MMMGIRPNNVSYLLTQLRHGSYLDPHPGRGDLEVLTNRVRKAGRLPESYYLHVDHVVSSPQTARMLIAALSLSRRTVSLRKSELISHLIERYGMQTEFAKERLDFCIANSYLNVRDIDAIAITDRTMAELPYLKLLASDCKEKNFEDPF
jgi:hypothetical protein